LTRGKRKVAQRLLYHARRRAQRREIPFALTVEDITVPDLCPVLATPLYCAAGQPAQGPNSPSLDRIDPARGYVPGNVRVISAKANAIKSNATPAELLRVACFVQEETYEDP